MEWKVHLSLLQRCRSTPCSKCCKSEAPKGHLAQISLCTFFALPPFRTLKSIAAISFSTLFALSELYRFAVILTTTLQPLFAVDLQNLTSKNFVKGCEPPSTTSTTHHRCHPHFCPLLSHPSHLAPHHVVTPFRALHLRFTAPLVLHPPALFCLPDRQLFLPFLGWFYAPVWVCIRSKPLTVRGKTLKQLSLPRRIYPQ